MHARFCCVTQHALLWYAGSVVASGVWAQLPWGIYDLNSLIRDGTCVPYTASQILNHWTTGEVPCLTILSDTDSTGLALAGTQFRNNIQEILPLISQHTG